MKRLRTIKRADIVKNKAREQRRLKIKLQPLHVAFWVLCFLCFFYSIFNIRDVIVDAKIIWLIGGLGGLAGILFTKDKRDYYFALLGYGSLIIGIPLFINNAFASTDNKTVKLKILDKTHRMGKHGPSVDIKFQDIPLEVMVDNDAEMDMSSFIILTISKGSLGYYIIRDTKLSKE